MTDTPKTDTVDVVVTKPAPVTAASAVVGYPHVLPATERRADIVFRAAGIILTVLGLLNVAVFAWAMATGAL